MAKKIFFPLKKVAKIGVFCPFKGLNERIFLKGENLKVKNEFFQRNIFFLKNQF